MLQRDARRIGKLGHELDVVHLKLFNRLSLLCNGVKPRLSHECLVFVFETRNRDVEGSKEVTLPNGIRYTELREGGGSTPQRGDLVVVNLTGRVASTGDVFIDTTAKGNRSVAFIFGARPLSGGMCDGVEYVLRSTRVGGKRRVTVPAALGFGETGTTLNTGVKIPGSATLEYVVELQKASIAPS